MKPEFFKQWTATRANGPVRYIVMRGVLGWGVPMFILMTYVVNDAPKSQHHLAIAVAVWLIGGAVFGWVTWLITEWQYAKALKAKDSSETASQ